VLFKVGKPFSFVPCKAHDIYVHNLCAQSRFFFIHKLLNDFADCIRAGIPDILEER
jgi:hypothetical protein